jgi:hypothetical protein
MELCQGYTIDLVAPEQETQGLKDAAAAAGDEGGKEAYFGPSLLGSTYLAAQVSLLCGFYAWPRP